MFRQLATRFADQHPHTLIDVPLVFCGLTVTARGYSSVFAHDRKPSIKKIPANLHSPCIPFRHRTRLSLLCKTRLYASNPPAVQPLVLAIRITSPRFRLLTDCSTPYPHATKMFPLETGINRHCLDRTKIKSTNQCLPKLQHL